MGPLRPNRPSDHVASYLARGESVVMEMKQHWARLLPAISSCLLGLFLVIVAGIFAPAWMGPTTNAAWWLWLVLVGHLLWRILEWHDETFVITNKRLILVHGLFVKKVAMMPLAKVTDMSYNRAPIARLLGYGTFKIESAGQEQALNVIDFVRDPDEKYRDICGLIFGLDDEDDPHPAHRTHASDGWYDDDDNSDERPSPPERDREWDAGEWDDDWDDEGWHDQSPIGSGTDDTEPNVVLPHDVDETDPYGYRVVTSPNHPAPQRHAYSDRTTRMPLPVDDADDAPDAAWSVSREHATAPQTVRPSRRSDPRSARRDAP